MAYPASLVSFFPFTEGAGSPVDVIRSFSGTLINGATWGSNAFGTCVSCPTSSGGVSLGTEGTNITLPTGDVTLLVIRRLRDTILDTGGYMVRLGGDGAADCITVLGPYSDGTVYFDYGGSSGAHRISWAGYTPATTVERWAFSQGSAGGKIYSGGTLRATGTQGTRTAGSSVLNVNFDAAAPGSVRQEFNHFALLSEQWSDATVAAWAGAGDPADFLATGAGGGGGGGGLATFFSSFPDVATDLAYVGGTRGAIYITGGVVGFTSVATPTPPPTFPLLDRIERISWRGSWRGSMRGTR